MNLSHKFDMAVQPKFATIGQVKKNWLNQEAKLILGAMKRNIKTTQQSRLPFREYVTQRPDSGWKKSFRIEKLSDNVRLIGPAQNKAISLSQTFEYGGDIAWSYAGLYSQSTRVMKSAFGKVIQGNKARRKKAFDSFLNHEQKFKNALAKIEKDGCKFDYYQGFMQEATIRALRLISTQDKENFEKIVDYYKSRWYEKHNKYVYYPFASKTFKELQGHNAITQRDFTRLATGGPNTILANGLQKATQEELERFCKDWNRKHPKNKQRLAKSLFERHLRFASTL